MPRRNFWATPPERCCFMKVGQTIFNQSSFSFFRIALCRAFVQLARKVLAVTFHSIETLNHTNLLDFPHCFSAWETVLFETIAFCSNISTRLLATELAKGKVGKQKRGFRSKQEILSLHFVSSIKQNGQQHSCS